MGPEKVVILHNVISPYKTWLFNAVHALYPNLHVLYISETEDIRQWNVDRNSIQFPFTVMFSENPERVPLIREVIETIRSLNTLNPDVLILGGWNYAAYWTGLAWAKIRGRRVIVWSSSTIEDHKRTFLKEKVKSFFVRRCHSANVYGTRASGYLEILGMPGDRIFIMGQTTINDYYAQEASRHRQNRGAVISALSLRPRNILFVGRLSEEKNLFSVLDAYKGIEAEAGDEWGLVFVGDGPMRPALQRHIAGNNIRGVTITGYKQREDLPMYLAAGDVLVLASFNETWGLVVNEAMSAGLPVIVSRKCGCYPDLIDEGSTGLSFNPMDTAQLAGHLRDVVTGKHDLAAMGRNAREKISGYTVENAARSVIKAIERALRK